jgi:methylglutaconyl-CoA hydratase
MAFDTLEFRKDDRGVAWITLNRPDKHNAMNAAMIGDLAGVAEKIATDGQIRCAVLTGAGESFCAGADLNWMREQFAADRNGRLTQARKLAQALRALNELPVPLIGRINGQAFGGGMGLICVCDIAIAANTAKFGFTETRLGLIPATISPYCVARMGEANARRVFMSGHRFGAGEAVTLGLLASAVSPEDLDAAVEAEIAPYLLCAPEAVGAAKSLVRSLGPKIGDDVLEMTVEKLADCWESPSALEGVQAFLEKRKPPWTS